MRKPTPPYTWLSTDGASSIVSTDNGYLGRHLDHHFFCRDLGATKDTIDHLRASWLDAQAQVA